jgi:type IV fimbrial biogenesis protein FimT
VLEPLMAADRMNRGFTLIELLIAVAVVAVILTLAAPSFQQFIILQRLKSINAQVITDMQYARSEAASRGQPVRVRFQATGDGDPSDMSCYIIYIDTNALPFSDPLCDCKAGEGARCTASTTQELRTVRVEASRSVMVAPNSADLTHFAFDPRNGGIALPPVDAVLAYPGEFAVNTYVSEHLKYTDLVGRSGRVKNCIPSGSTLPGDVC